MANQTIYPYGAGGQAPIGTDVSTKVDKEYKTLRLSSASNGFVFDGNIGSDGGVNSSSLSKYSLFTPVLGGSTMTFNLDAADASKYVAFYSSADESGFISAVQVTSRTETAVDVPANARYFRASARITSTPSYVDYIIDATGEGLQEIENILDIGSDAKTLTRQDIANYGIVGSLSYSGNVRPADTVYRSTPYLLVQNDTDVKFLGKNNYTYLCVFAEDKTFLFSIKSTGAELTWRVPPKGVYYIRFSVSGSNSEYLTMTGKDTSRTLDGISKMLSTPASWNGTKIPVRILFIGNSLQQDAVAYLPLVLNEYRDYIDYKLYLWYCGGYTLQQQYAKFTANGTAEIFSVCENGVSWTNYNSAKTMSEVLSTYDIDIVSIQEFFHNRRYENGEITAEDKAAFANVIDYVKTNYNEGDRNYLDFYSFWEAPIRGSMETAEKNFTFAAEGLQWEMKNGTIGIIPAGIAVYRAIKRHGMETLGEGANMSAPDNIHSQEGLACLMQAWVIGQWIYRLFGLPYDVCRSNVKLTADIVSALNVPGGNGTLIVGTDWQHRVAQGIAKSAFEEGKYHEAINSVTPASQE